MDRPTIKPLHWVASAREDIRAFPQTVRNVMGTALYFAQAGAKHPRAKPLKGVVRGAGVLEIVDDHDGDTFRTVYTVRFPHAVYVLHAFQKKSKKRSSTPKHEIELIRARYELAKSDYETKRDTKKRRKT